MPALAAVLLPSSLRGRSRRVLRVQTFLAAAVTAGILAACTSGGAASSASDAGSVAQGAGDEAGTVGCGGQGDTYTANLAKPGASGVYTFTLVQAAPAPPDLNANVWTFKATDKTGTSPDLAQVVVYPFMPLMGHGSDQTPTVTANADGTFTATDIQFFMPGLWTVTLSVTEAVDAGAADDAAALPSKTPVTIDQVVYTFCVN
jgi:hypothetical protein